MIKYQNKMMTATQQPTCEGCPFDKGDRRRCRSKNYKGCTATYETKSRMR